jgi:hypothetical protein
MMIAISSAVYDATYSPVVINRDHMSVLGEQKARVSRSATLDGGAVIVHQGVSAGDRTFHIDAEVTETQESNLKSLFGNGVNGCLVSTADGVFFGSLSEVKAHKGRIKATILIKSKESS